MRVTLGSGQAARQRPLEPPIAGSNPASPAPAICSYGQVAFLCSPTRFNLFLVVDIVPQMPGTGDYGVLDNP